MKKIKITTTLLISAIAIGVLFFSINSLTSATVTAVQNSENEDNNKTLEKPDNNYNSTSNQGTDSKKQENSVTPDNYQDALKKYISEHPEKLDPNDPSDLFNSFMEENNLESLQTCNY